MQDNRVGFTLVELLVVVTIIVVLLALLTPAMDMAIYQAELAVCAAQLKGVGASVQAYALNHRRDYPYRTLARNADIPPMLRNGNTVPPTDDRFAVRNAVDMPQLVDPLTGKIRIDIHDTDADSWVASTYSLWFGFSFVNSQGMLKIGDRFAWDDARDWKGNVVGGRFSLLAADRDALGGGAECSHPDRDMGMMLQYVLQNANDNFYEREGTNNTVAPTVTKLTVALWRNRVAQRGPVDLNYLYADGSVTRLGGVVKADERTLRVPKRGNATDWNAGGSRDQVPRE